MTMDVITLVPLFDTPPHTLISLFFEQREHENKLRPLTGSGRGPRRPQQRNRLVDVFTEKARNPVMFKKLCGFTLDEFRCLLEKLEHAIRSPRNVYGGYDNTANAFRRRRASTLSTENRMLIFLFWLRSRKTLVHLASDFGVSMATIDLEVKHVREAVLTQLHDEIRWPDAETRAELAKLVPGFPGAIGYIDATSKRIQRPTRNHRESYRGDKGYNEQVIFVVTPWGEIINICYGIDGCTNDRGAFIDSDMGRNPHRYFTDGQYLLGDGGYRGPGDIVCPFSIREVRRSSVYGNFNEGLRRHRVTVERVFGHVFHNQWQRFSDRWTGCKDELSPTAHAAALLSNWLFHICGPLVNLSTLLE